jgi:hypothetical protein
MCDSRAWCYGRRMRVKRSDLDTALDVGFAVVGVGLTAVATWAPASLIGTTVSGPPRPLDRSLAWRVWAAGSAAGGDGAGGVGDPVGPRADVEGGGDAGERQGEDLMRRGHA